MKLEGDYKMDKLVEFRVLVNKKEVILKVVFRITSFFT